MNRLLVDLVALKHNFDTISTILARRNASWTVVTKMLCGQVGILKALKRFGAPAMGESRLENLRVIRGAMPEMKNWLLRVPSLSTVAEVIRLCHVSLNSELRIIKALNEHAGRAGVSHGIVIMIELGDLREGVLPGSLVHFYESVFMLPHIHVLGIGANLGCLAGAVPSIDQFMQLVLYRELLELKFGRQLPLISAGTSVSLSLLAADQLPQGINHFRIGEALFLGTDLLHGGTLPGLRNDVFLLETEVVEMKKKSLVQGVETSAEISPFTDAGYLGGAENAPAQRGWRALVEIGHLDADISGLTPLNSQFSIAGASSDLTVLNVGPSKNNLKVGEFVRFRMNYAALLRLMGSRYLQVDIRGEDNLLPSVPATAQKQTNTKKARRQNRFATTARRTAHA